MATCYQCKEKVSTKLYHIRDTQMSINDKYRYFCSLNCFIRYQIVTSPSLIRIALPVGFKTIEGMEKR